MRVQRIDDRDMCLRGPCRFGWRAPVRGNVCVETCPAWVYDPGEDERRCVEQCQDGSPPASDGHCGSCAEEDPNAPLYFGGGCTDACPPASPFYQRTERVCQRECPPEEPFHLAGACRPRCPPTSFRLPGCFRCEPATNSSQTPGRVSFGGASLAFALRLAPSYASLELGLGERAAAFLQTGDTIARLRLRARTEAEYAPAVFFRAGTVLGCELQLAAPRPDGSALLGAVLLRDARLLGCLLVGSFREGGELPVALRPRGHGARALLSVVELGPAVTAAGLTVE